MKPALVQQSGLQAFAVHEHLEQVRKLTAGRWAEPVGGVMYTDPHPVRGLLPSPCMAPLIPPGVWPWLA